MRPIAALLIPTTVLWTWRLPSLYDAALESDGVHLVEHATILLAYLLFWRPLIAPGTPPVVLETNLGRATYIVAGAGQAAVLGGAIMWFSGAVVFAIAAAMAFRDRG